MGDLIYLCMYVGDYNTAFASTYLLLFFSSPLLHLRNWVVQAHPNQSTDTKANYQTNLGLKKKIRTYGNSNRVYLRQNTKFWLGKVIHNKQAILISLLLEHGPAPKRQ